MQAGDQGMLGLAIDPLYGAGRNYVYVQYVLDEIPGENDPPHWGDSCPDLLGEGCVVTSTVARIEVDPASNTFVDSVDLLTGRTCLQFHGHSANDLAFGPDGNLYLSIGDGASFQVADYGQLGGNPCQDPPAPEEPTPANSEGGALRTMDLLTSIGGESNDPVWYNGVILRVNPDTGAAAAGNPLEGIGVAGDDHIIAHGLRNPWRIDFRPGTDELWIGDVGWGEFEEFNVIADVNDPVVENFGWPCYEGPEPHAIYSSYGLCQTIINNPDTLFLATDLTDPWFPYDHADPVGACPGGSSAISGLAFGAEDSPYPDEYDGALFFTDYGRSCLWAMLPDANGVPDPDSIDTLATGVIIVDMDIAPDGSLLVVEVGNFTDGGGRIRRLDFVGANLPPTAVIEANTLSGTENDTVFEFDGSGSFDPEGGALTYQWDLDGDGGFDASGPTADIVYTEPGSYEVVLRVTDPEGARGEAAVIVNVSNTPPVATITSPTSPQPWSVGDTVTFSGTGTDGEDGTLAPDTPGREWEWNLILHHCPDNDCHQHVDATWTGVDSGTFTTPDHEYPSWLELVLTVHDSTGASASTSVELQPATTIITLQTEPAGLMVAGGVEARPQTAPFTIEAIEGGKVSIVTPTPQTAGGAGYTFESWSDGGSRIHDVVVPTDDVTITARFNPTSLGDGFQSGWTAVNPSAPWSYWWNQDAPLGDSTGYAPLQWNGTSYNSDGGTIRPSDDEFAYGSIQPWAIHPGLSVNQGAAADRHAIIRYSAPETGSYAITGSTITDLDCPSGGVDLTILVDNTIVSTMTHTGQDPGSFDQSLGSLPAGTTIDVAIGPGDYDYCDSTALDFFVTYTDEPDPDTGTTAGYRDDITGPEPAPGWSYWWNQDAPLGDSTGYAPLQWNGTSYNSDGGTIRPSDDEFAYGSIQPWAIHPGLSVNQGAAADRHAIIRYSAPETGSYAITGSTITDLDCPSGGVDLTILVDNTIVSTMTHTGQDPGSFDQSLGSLPAGTTIDVAIGPGDYDYCDSTALDFFVTYTDEPDPDTGTTAGYRDDITGPEPAPGWSYWWNQDAPLGDSSGYAPLQWNGTSYNSDGGTIRPSDDEFAYGSIQPWAIHPGLSVNQGAAADRHAIIRYSAPETGSYAITGSTITDLDCPSGGVDLTILVDNTIVSTMTHTGQDPGSFDQSLGSLPAGTTIDVAIGPGDYDYCDSTALDFFVTYTS